MGSPSPTLPPGVESRDPAAQSAIDAALAQRGPPPQPRTRHVDPNGAPVFANRLALENSPYLQQHAHNPVDWYPWGEEAFERARREDKPILLSVGYSTCHWCHVMEEESFEDLAIAEYINTHFVPIKVDREERPDVDAVYMRAVQALTGRGGWPMTVVLDTDHRPVFAGTYIPPRKGVREARQGLVEILEKLVDRWQNDRDLLMVHAKDTSQRMALLAQPPNPKDVPPETVFPNAMTRITASFDKYHGGFGKAPKFPRPTELTWLLTEHTRTGEEAPRNMALVTLAAIAKGGIRDHVGGGFHRYAVDNSWDVPHFEKMLYDQAQLVDAYLDAYQVAGPEWAAVARDTIDYVLREMRDPEGGFRCATDADSLNPDGELEEGRFFTWTPNEMRAVLGDRAELGIAAYGVSDQGPVEGRSVLVRRKAPSELAVRIGVEPDAIDAELLEVRKALFQARKNRPPPLQDDKVVMAWNALMISALARASRVLDEPLYAEAARKAARFANRHLTDEQGRFARSWRAGTASNDAVLVDYALHTLALIDLFEATGEPDWLFLATQLANQMNERFGDPEGGWWETAHDAERLLTRGKPHSDGALPSGNSAALFAMVRLHQLTGEDAWRERADKGFTLFGAQLETRGPSMPLMLEALAFRTSDPRQVVLIPGEGADAMRAVLNTTHQPFKVLFLPKDGLSQNQMPLAKGKTAIDGKATAYVCYQGLCEQPTTDPEVFRAQLTRRRE